jgi:hypothetical protein
MLFLVRHFFNPPIPAGPGACVLWRGLRQCPIWGCVRLREQLDKNSTAHVRRK